MVQPPVSVEMICAPCVSEGQSVGEAPELLCCCCCCVSSEPARTAAARLRPPLFLFFLCAAAADTSHCSELSAPLRPHAVCEVRHVVLPLKL